MNEEERLIEAIDVIGKTIERLAQQRIMINKGIVKLIDRREDFILSLETLRNSGETKGGNQ